MLVSKHTITTTTIMIKTNTNNNNDKKIYNQQFII